MTDLLYVLITVVAFAAMALLIGVLDRRLSDRTPAATPATPATPQPEPGEPAAAGGGAR